MEPDDDFSYRRGQMVADRMDHQRRMMAATPRSIARPLPISARAADVSSELAEGTVNLLDEAVAVADTSVAAVSEAVSTAVPVVAESVASTAGVVANTISTAAVAANPSWQCDTHMMAAIGVTAIAIGIGSMAMTSRQRPSCQSTLIPHPCPPSVHNMLSYM